MTFANMKPTVDRMVAVIRAGQPHISSNGGGTSIEGPAGIALYRLIAQRSALSLECKGIHIRRGFSAYAQIKREWGFKGSRASVLEQFTACLAAAELVCGIRTLTVR